MFHSEKKVLPRLFDMESYLNPPWPGNNGLDPHSPYPTPVHSPQAPVATSSSHSHNGKASSHSSASASSSRSSSTTSSAHQWQSTTGTHSISKPSWHHQAVPAAPTATSHWQNAQSWLSPSNVAAAWQQPSPPPSVAWPPSQQQQFALAQSYHHFTSQPSWQSYQNSLPTYHQVPPSPSPSPSWLQQQQQHHHNQMVLQQQQQHARAISSASSTSSLTSQHQPMSPPLSVAPPPAPKKQYTELEVPKFMQKGKKRKSDSSVPCSSSSSSNGLSGISGIKHLKARLHSGSNGSGGSGSSSDFFSDFRDLEVMLNTTGNNPSTSKTSHNGKTKGSSKRKQQQNAIKSDSYSSFKDLEARLHNTTNDYGSRGTNGSGLNRYNSGPMLNGGPQQPGPSNNSNFLDKNGPFDYDLYEKKEKKKKEKKKVPLVLPTGSKMARSTVKMSVVLDVSIWDHENQGHLQDCVKRAAQIESCHGFNQRLSNPVQFHLAGLHGKAEEVVSAIPGFKDWDVHLHGEDYHKAFPHNSIIYLSSESDTPLEKLEDDKVYIVGGLFENKRNAGQAHRLAQERGIRHAKLPVNESVLWEMGKELRVDQKFQMLGEARMGIKWRDAYLNVLTKFQKKKMDD